tara:strand:+ start:3851 stop:4618 length:768 start_codon:yes stop_codon:yes gene_type:complete
MLPLHRDVEENGLSFMCRVKNEAGFLDRNLASFYGLRINYEIVVIMNECTDDTEAVIDRHIDAGLPIRKYKYDTRLAIPGLQHLCTPINSFKSLCSHSIFSLSKCRMSYIFWWDSDFQMNDHIKSYLESFDFEDKENKMIRFNAKVPWSNISNEEIYMFNCIVGMKKGVFTQVRLYNPNSKEVRSGVPIYCQDKEEKPKDYWYQDPWFLGTGSESEKKYNKIVEAEGKPHPLSFRASSPHFDGNYWLSCKKYLTE